MGSEVGTGWGTDAQGVWPCWHSWGPLRAAQQGRHSPICPGTPGVRGHHRHYCIHGQSVPMCVPRRQEEGGGRARSCQVDSQARTGTQEEVGCLKAAIKDSRSRAPREGGWPRKGKPEGGLRCLRDTPTPPPLRFLVLKMD